MKENLNNERDMVEIDLWKLLGAYLSRWKLIVAAAAAAAEEEGSGGAQ